MAERRPLPSDPRRIAPPLAVGPALRRTLLDVHGPAAAAWIDGLPALLAACAARWRLAIGAPFAPPSYAFVAPARRADGAAVVVKAAPPGRALAAEAAALAAFDGRGAVRLLAADLARGVVLLERVQPGTPLLALVEAGRDDEATAVAASVMRGLQHPSPAMPPPTLGFPTVADWVGGLARLRARYDGGTGPLPARLVARAEALAAALGGPEAVAPAAAMATSPPAAPPAPRPALLHGDLHHGNVLDGGADGWRAIDPHGVVGEPAFEAAALLRNPLPWLLAGGERAARDILARRIAILAEALDAEPARVAGWGLVGAVLSAWWSVEDHGAGWEGAIAVAAAIEGTMTGGRAAV